MNTQPNDPQQQEVSTEPQRIALEQMSADLVHKLNLMIAEQEERVRVFAEQHHSQSPFPEQGHATLLPEHPVTPTPDEPEEEIPLPVAKKPLVAKFKAIARRTLPTVPADDTPRHYEPDRPAKRVSPIQPTRPASGEKEESKIGIGTIVTFIVIVLFLLRACS